MFRLKKLHFTVKMQRKHNERNKNGFERARK